MKTSNAAILLSLSMGLSTVVAAEPFNKRGEDWVRTVVSSKQTAARSENYPITPSLGFRDRGEDWLAKVMPGASGRISDQCPLDAQLATHLEGFNNQYNFQC